jgi:AraC-like DNA-binding protein
MSLVIRLSAQPIRLVDDLYPSGRDYGFAVVGGMRSSFYVRDISGPVYAIGAVLLPSAPEVLLGLSAIELAQRHIRLDEVWGTQSALLREQLLEMRSPEARLNLFESFLLSRLTKLRGMHPAVAQALVSVRTISDIRMLVAESGYSHRRFIELFSQTVGLTPKLYSRVLRFQKALQLVASAQSNVLSNDKPIAWADLALAAGFSDQSHFNREFIEFAGITPEEYRKIGPASPSHVVIKKAQRRPR